MSNSNCLIAYYSRRGQNYLSGEAVDLPVGNTEIVARMIQAETGGDLLHLQTVREYPVGYLETTQVAKKELRQNARPDLKSQPEDIERYDTVFLGYPNWCGTAPMAVFTFLAAHDFTGKTILPFCTHEGSGLGRSDSDIRRACPHAEVLDGLAIRGGSVRGAEKTIRRWIEATGLAF